MEPGRAWRRHCWTKARRNLLPRMPLEIVRMRMARAREIGLDYKTYATVRATTGRDVVAVLFSTNALRLFKANQRLDADRATKLAAMTGCQRTALAVRPLSPEQVISLAKHGDPAPLDHAAIAPRAWAGWSETRHTIRDAIGKTPADAVLLIGDTSAEREWCSAGQLAGYLDAERFFEAHAV